MPNPSTLNHGPRAIKAGGVLHNKYTYNGLRVINKTGSAIAIDKLVAVVGFDTTSLRPKVVLADADDNTHKNVYIALDAIANDAEGVIYKGGPSAVNLNTNSATTVGDPVYLSGTAGGFSHTAPTTGTVIPVGWVTVKSATVGSIDWYIFPSEAGGGTLGSESVEVVAATNVITAAESGKTFFLSSATEFVSTLPAPAAGLKYRFIVTAAPSGASYTIVTDAAAQILVGGVHDAGGAAGDVESTAGATTITFVDGQAVIGDWAEVISDGTNWYARVFVNVATGATFTG